MNFCIWCVTQFSYLMYLKNCKSNINLTFFLYWWSVKYYLRSILQKCDGSAPTYHLVGRWPTIRHFLHTSKDGFIIKPPYMDKSILCAAQRGRQAVNFLTPVRHKGRQICTNTFRKTNLLIASSRSGILRKYVCHCAVFYEIRGRYHCLFNQGFGKLVEYEEQMFLGLSW